MGVNHLKRDASAAAGGSAAGNSRRSPESTQVQALSKPASTSGTRQVPQVGSVNSFGNRGARPGNSAAQPPKGNDNGGRAGAKGGQEHVGERSGNKKGMSGGRLG